MLAFRLVYHDGYDLHIGDHVFPGQKYRLTRDKLLSEGLAEPGDLVSPEPAPDEDLRLAHNREWIERLRTGTLTYHDIQRLEVPYSRAMVEAFRLAAGGTLLASRLALRDGLGFNLSGGFHHAFPDHGEGFCAINDVAVAIQRLRREGAITRAMVVDCDVHQGNGTASIFAGDSEVLTLSIHQLNNYPAVKPPSDIDIDLADQTGDEEYLEKLKRFMAPAMEKHAPNLLIYLAGADPYYQDQLGGLGLTMAGLRQRDRFVLETARRHRVPVAVTLAGGYAFRVEDTVAIHVNTVKAAAEAMLATVIRES
jgi:acetoin utilization deacetylase AcuC-like enzyme